MSDLPPLSKTEQSSLQKQFIFLNLEFIRIVRTFTVTIIMICLYITVVLLVLHILRIESLPSFIALAVGAFVIAIPAVDLDRSLTQTRKLRALLKKLNSSDLDLFREVVMRGEFEAAVKDGAVNPVLTDTKDPSSQSNDQENDKEPLPKVLKEIAKDTNLREYVNEPLMQESHSARLRYLSRVWPKTGPQLKTKE
jgi:hypothetical protein